MASKQATSHTHILGIWLGRCGCVQICYLQHRTRAWQPGPLLDLATSRSTAVGPVSPKYDRSISIEVRLAILRNPDMSTKVAAPQAQLLRRHGECIRARPPRPKGWSRRFRRAAYHISPTAGSIAVVVASTPAPYRRNRREQRPFARLAPCLDSTFPWRRRHPEHPASEWILQSRNKDASRVTQRHPAPEFTQPASLSRFLFQKPNPLTRRLRRKARYILV